MSLLGYGRSTSGWLYLHILHLFYMNIMRHSEQLSNNKLQMLSHVNAGQYTLNQECLGITIHHILLGVLMKQTIRNEVQGLPG